MTKVLTYLVAEVCLLTLCHNATAQNDTTIHREINQVEIVASQYIHKSSLQQSINADEIKVLGISNIADAMRLFNGLNIKDYGSVGGLKTVSVRSLGAAHTAIEYDGLPVTNNQAGPVDISRFDISQISNLQISVGQDDNLLKPAKFFASAATLSIKSKMPNFNLRRNNFNLSLKSGSYGYFFSNVNFAQRLGKNSALKFETEFMRADGIYEFQLVNNKTVTTEKRNNSDVKLGKLELNYYYNDSVRCDFNIKFYGFVSDRGLPGGVIYYNPAAYERLNDKNYFVQTNFKYRITNNYSIRLVSKCNYSYNLYSDRKASYTNGLLQQKSTQNEAYISLANLYQPVSCLAFGLSLDESFNTLEADITDRNPKRNSLIIALNAKYSYHNVLTIRAIGVATQIREHSDFGTCMNDVNRISPTFAMVATPFKYKKLSMQLMYKNTYRVPTFNELYYTTLGTTGLVPEDAQEFNFGLSLNDKNFGISADFFKNIVENKIVAIPTMYIWKMSNYGNVEITGLDFNAFCNVKFNFATLNLHSGYSYQKALDKTKKNPKLYNSQIPYTPLHSGNYSLTLKFKYLDLAYHSIWSGKRYFLEYNIPDNEIDAYMEQTVSVSREFDFKKIKVFTKFSCINIGDKQYDIIKFYPMPGRHYEIQFNFSI